MPLKVFSFSYYQDHHTRNRNQIEHRPKNCSIYRSYKTGIRNSRVNWPPCRILDSGPPSDFNLDSYFCRSIISHLLSIIAKNLPNILTNEASARYLNNFIFEFSSQIVKIENFWNVSDRSEHPKTTLNNMPTSALNRKIQIWNSEIFLNNLLKMHNLE